MIRKILLLVIITALLMPYGAECSAEELSDAYFFAKSKWENDRLHALKIFIDRDDENAVAYVVKMLNDRCDEVRERACEALIRLGHVKDRISVPALIERMKIEPREKVLQRMTYALASFSEEENTAMTLVEAFKTMPGEQKYALIDSLAPLIKEHRLGFTNFFEVLKTAVNDSDDLLRLHAVVCMGEFGDTDYVLKPLLKSLTDQSSDVRLVACRYLGRIKPIEALNPLISRGLNDVSPAVRKEAVMAVAEYKNPDSYEFFTKVLKDDLDGETRAEAALAFIGLADRRAIVPLKLALLDSANVVRLNSAYALTLFDNYDGEGELVWFLWEQNLPQYRRRAIKGLANINSRSVTDDLERALKDWDDEVRDTAFYALRHRWGYRITQ